MQMLSVVIFRNNLRTIDNAPLYWASRSDATVIGLYVNPSAEATTYGFSRIGEYRKAFLRASLESLKTALKPLSIALHVTSDPKATLQHLSQRYELTLYFMREAGSEEQQMEQLFETYEHKAYETQTLLEPFTFDPYRSFSAFRKKAQKRDIPAPLGLPKTCTTLPDLENALPVHTPCPLVITPGIESAHARLDAYMPFIHTYKERRAGFEGKMMSTALSAYLSVGSLSPRSVYWRIKEEEKTQGASSSSEWIIQELLWRDFFHLAMRQLQRKLFMRGGIFDKAVRFRDDPQVQQRFFDAQTGVDIIDAAVTELLKTGHSSNRSRQLMASYFVKNLGLDWRVGAAWFESLLIDYNPACNYGNWAYQAHVGHDSIYRIFDPQQQSQRYGGSDFVRKWLGRDERASRVDYHTMANQVKNEIFQLD